MTDDRTQNDAPSPGQPEDSQTRSDQDERVEDMERAIERVDDHIEDARDKAEEAESHDPQPLTQGGDEQDDTR